jgi:hypothetical protein
MRIVIPNLTAVLAIAASLAWPSSASALTDLILNVDCASGARIGQALNRPTLFDRRLVVVVSGTCVENVTIERDDVILRSQGTGGVSAADPSKPAILINGARRVALEGLSVVGGLHGVQATRGASVTIRTSHVRSAVRNGALIDMSSSAVVEASTMESNGEAGIAALASAVTMTGSIVRGNTFYGVWASRGASAILGGTDTVGNVCCGNTIENNTLDGVLVNESSSAEVFGNIIQGNGTVAGRIGVNAVRGSSVQLRGGNVVRYNGNTTGAGGGVFASAAAVRVGPLDYPVNPPTNQIYGNTVGFFTQMGGLLDLRSGVSVTGNTVGGVVVDTGSRLRLENGTISSNGNNGIFAQRGSGVDLVGVNVVNDNANYGLYCADGESSFSGPVGGIMGNRGTQQVSCTGY